VSFTSRVSGGGFNGGWSQPDQGKMYKPSAAGSHLSLVAEGGSKRLMGCHYFQAIWERTQLDEREQAFFHGTVRSQSGAVGYPRLTFFLEREPPRDAPCLCGASSAWHCWNKTRSAELLGGARR
jgi:hypothetical protein